MWECKWVLNLDASIRSTTSMCLSFIWIRKIEHGFFHSFSFSFWKSNNKSLLVQAIVTKAHEGDKIDFLKNDMIVVAAQL